jgi:hypothetical protein
MKKQALVIFTLIFLAVHGRADTGDFAGAAPALFASFSGGETGLMYGMGIRCPFYFYVGELRDDWTNSGYMIAPALTAESDFAGLLRLRGGLHVGKWEQAFVIWLNYYAGASGIFMRNFSDNVSVAGITPEIGLEFGIVSFTSRVQLQYEWYTNPRYNGFVVTVSCGIWLLL